MRLSQSVRVSTPCGLPSVFSLQSFIFTFIMATRALTLITLGLLQVSRAAQPTRKGTPGTFEVVGESGVSAQQLFLGSGGKVCSMRASNGIGSHERNI